MYVQVSTDRQIDRQIDRQMWVIDACKLEATHGSCRVKAGFCSLCIYMYGVYILLIAYLQHSPICRDGCNNNTFRIYCPDSGQLGVYVSVCVCLGL